VLRQTFVHIPEVDGAIERSLWSQGCWFWTDFLQRHSTFDVGAVDRDKAKEHIERSVEELDAGRHQFFRSLLGGRDAWRAWPEFRDSCVYLDIETDGGLSGNSVTCIGLYDGRQFTCLTKYKNLGDFPDLIATFRVIVTFFGSGFDVPILKRAFPNVTFDHIHIDLCHVLKRLGYRGGLKRIERELGIARPDETAGLSGLDAVRLWREHLAGRSAALETLIAYNREDVVNLETLTEIAYRKMKTATMGQLLLEFPG
jgi:uncharacterized protein YprB with RNaseH-like and TPR domain